MNKSKNKGCISGVLGTALVVLGVAVYAVISSLFNRLFVGMSHGDAVACALMTKWLVGVGISFILYEAIFILWQFDILKKSKAQQENGKKSKNAFRLIAASCICVSLLLGIIFANTYVDCREDSISKVCFVTVKEYKWDEDNDIRRYSFSCDESGGLSFKITMKDGEVVELFGNVSSASSSFSDKYSINKVNLLSYAACLAEEFDSSGFIIEKTVSGIEYMEKFYHTPDCAEIWACIERITETVSN